MFKIVWFETSFNCFQTDDCSEMLKMVDSLMSLDRVSKIVVYEDGFILRNIYRSKEGWLDL